MKVTHVDVENSISEIQKLKEVNCLLNEKSKNLESENVELQAKNKELNKQIEQVKKEKLKIEKEFSDRIGELKYQLQESFDNVKMYCDANTVLQEEKKALTDLLNINSELQDDLTSLGSNKLRYSLNHDYNVF